MRAAYDRAKMLTASVETARVCEQLALLCVTATMDDETLSPLPIHRCLAEHAPTPQSREMHRTLHLLLSSAADDTAASLTLRHVQAWAAFSSYFVMQNVRQAAAQFAKETEELLRELIEKQTAQTDDPAGFHEHFALQSQALHDVAKGKTFIQCMQTELGEQGSKCGGICVGCQISQRLVQHAEGVSRLRDSLDGEAVAHKQCQGQLSTAEATAESLRRSVARWEAEFNNSIVHLETLRNERDELKHRLECSEQRRMVEHEENKRATVIAERDALRKERDALLVDTCHGCRVHSLGYCMRSLPKKPKCLICNDSGKVASDEPYMQMALVPCSCQP